MIIETLPDLIIVASGAIALVALVLVTVLFVLLYRRLNRVLKQAETVSQKAVEISTCLGDAVKPSAQAFALIQVSLSAINFLRRRKGAKDGGKR
ncbi:MAG: hypothetical protein WC369_00830 [Dehalococcoidales bacterium]